jgi:hypothetical protein
MNAGYCTFSNFVPCRWRCFLHLRRQKTQIVKIFLFNGITVCKMTRFLPAPFSIPQWMLHSPDLPRHTRLSPSLDCFSSMTNKLRSVKLWTVSWLFVQDCNLWAVMWSTQRIHFIIVSKKGDLKTLLLLSPSRTVRRGLSGNIGICLKNVFNQARNISSSSHPSKFEQQLEVHQVHLTWASG